MEEHVDGFKGPRVILQYFSFLWTSRKMVRSRENTLCHKLDQLAKLLLCQATVPNDSGERVCIDWIVPGYRDDSLAICHHNMLALTCYAEARLLKSFYCALMRNTRDAGHD